MGSSRRFDLIGTGAKPVELRIPGGEHLVTSDQFLELDDLPDRVVFVGGGYISFEFAHVAARAGARAAILHRGPRPLHHFDPDLVDQVVARTRAIGVDVHVQTEVRAIEEASGSLVVHTSSAGRAGTVEADLVVHGAGRVPDVGDLGLDAAGVEWDLRRGIRVDEYLQSVSNPAVYAGGDAADTGGPALTPVAGADARIIASNLLEGNHRTSDYSIVPSVVFTVPPLASVGLLERTARAGEYRFSVRHEDTSGWYSSRRIGESCSGYKILVEEGTGRIFGAHLLGPGAEETINLFALAMRAGMPAPAIKDILLAYPTHASDVQYMV